jgi:hypothetical protein
MEKICVPISFLEPANSRSLVPHHLFSKQELIHLFSGCKIASSFQADLGFFQRALVLFLIWFKPFVILPKFSLL